MCLSSLSSYSKWKASDFPLKWYALYLSSKEHKILSKTPPGDRRGKMSAWGVWFAQGHTGQQWKHWVERTRFSWLGFIVLRPCFQRPDKLFLLWFRHQRAWVWNTCILCWYLSKYDLFYQWGRSFRLVYFGRIVWAEGLRLYWSIFHKNSDQVFMTQIWWGKLPG